LSARPTKTFSACTRYSCTAKRRKLKSSRIWKLR
jgi:hypothetical protein